MLIFKIISAFKLPVATGKACVSSAQTGGERARLAPEVSLAGVPRGPKEGAIVVVEPSNCLGDIDIVVVHGGT